MSYQSIACSGRYLRVADPGWADPLDPAFAAAGGGRWNPPVSFGVLYLDATERVARLNTARLYLGLPYGPEDLDPGEAPILVAVQVGAGAYLDCLTDDGLDLVGLPGSYPDDEHGIGVSHSVCQPIGQQAFDDGLAGVNCRSAAPGANRPDEELAWFDRGTPRPTEEQRQVFDDWFWGP